MIDDNPRKRRFKDLSNWDVLIFAVTTIVISESLGKLGLVKESQQVPIAMLVVGLFLAIRLCWPMRDRRWFWPYGTTFAIAVAGVAKLVSWTADWMAASAFALLAFATFSLFVRGADWLDQRRM